MCHQPQTRWWSLTTLTNTCYSDWSTFQSTFQATFKPLLKPANAANYARQFVTFARSASQKELAYFGVLGAEILGFFTVGEIVGRRKLIGYRGDTKAHH
jgi:F-type H+-transporting ATPase subunit g